MKGPHKVYARSDSGATWEWMGTLASDVLAWEVAGFIADNLGFFTQVEPAEASAPVD